MTSGMKPFPWPLAVPVIGALSAMSWALVIGLALLLDQCAEAAL